MSLWGEPFFSDLLAGGYLALLTLMWLGLVVGAGRYGARWRIPRPEGPPPEDGPLVSVCIPARNEALNIGACVAGALALRWPALEVVVVDDRSEDGTGDAAREAGAGDPRLHVIEGTEPPAGWAGKAWACARAAGEARGRWLLFLDADVRIDPDALRALMGVALSEELRLLSVFGTWELVSFWERALIPTVGWLIRGAVDLDRVNDPTRVEAFANGQLILAEREAYDFVGGHAAIRDRILDDVSIAEAFKRRGMPIGLRPASWAFRVRLYRSLGEIVAGYGKNLYEGMGRRPTIGLGAVLFIFVGTLLPYLALAAALVGRLALGWGVPGWGWVGWLALICGLQFLFRVRVERHDGRAGAIAWVHPISNLLLVGIILRSMFWVEASWKGRRFVDGRAR
jgi:glycosyltransferase involved in cell wall biosynthesis